MFSLAAFVILLTQAVSAVFSGLVSSARSKSSMEYVEKYSSISSQDASGPGGAGICFATLLGVEEALDLLVCFLFGIITLLALYIASVGMILRSSHQIRMRYR